MQSSILGDDSLVRSRNLMFLLPHNVKLVAVPSVRRPYGTILLHLALIMHDSVARIDGERGMSDRDENKTGTYVFRSDLRSNQVVARAWSDTA